MLNTLDSNLPCAIKLYNPSMTPITSRTAAIINPAFNANAPNTVALAPIAFVNTTICAPIDLNMAINPAPATVTLNILSNNLLK